MPKKRWYLGAKNWRHLNRVKNIYIVSGKWIASWQAATRNHRHLRETSCLWQHSHVLQRSSDNHSEVFFYIFSADIPGWQVWLICFKVFATLFAVAVNLWRASLQDSSSKMHSMEATTCRCQSFGLGCGIERSTQELFSVVWTTTAQASLRMSNLILVWFAV